MGMEEEEMVMRGLSLNPGVCGLLDTSFDRDSMEEEEEGASLEGGLIQRQEGGARTIILTAGVLEQLRGRAREEQGRVGEYSLITFYTFYTF